MKTKQTESIEVYVQEDKFQVREFVLLHKKSLTVSTEFDFIKLQQWYSEQDTGWV